MWTQKGKFVLYATIQLLLCIPRIMSTERNTHYTVYANEVIDAFVREMKQDFGMDCMGSGGSMPYNIRDIDVMLSVCRVATIEEARFLGILGTRKLLKIINEHENIRPFLCKHPFTSKNVCLSISFFDSSNKYYLDGKVASISLLHGKVFYDKAEIHKVLDPGLICGKTGKYLRQPKEVEDETLVTIFRETYEEAEAIVQKEKRSM